MKITHTKKKKTEKRNRNRNTHMSLNNKKPFPNMTCYSQRLTVNHSPSVVLNQLRKTWMHMTLSRPCKRFNYKHMV